MSFSYVFTLYTFYNIISLNGEFVPLEKCWNTI